LRKLNQALLTVLFVGTVSGAPKIAFDGAQFRVTGWNADAEPVDGWSSVFRVYAGSPHDPPMLGSYAVRDHELAFRPRFPISTGVRYHAIFQSASERAEADFDGTPSARNAITRVERIYPSILVLPSNALRLYIYFSAPMSRGEAWQHIRLIDLSRNRPVELPFLELEQELWDQNNQRLTVLFDPGRIKRGLVPTTTIGPAIVEGKQYKLMIDRGWHDARGVGLIEGSEKIFRGGPSDRIPPAPRNWRVTAPRSGSADPLVITFPKPMDYVLLQRMIGIFDAQGAEIAGKIAIAENETRWSFTPNEPWKSGAYRVTADNTLEDISGNHLDRPFDVDIFETVTKHISASSTSIKFSIR